MGDAGKVHVDPDALRKYGLDLFSNGQTETLKVTQHLSNLAPLLQSLTTPTDAGTFAEGAVIAGALMQSMSDFSAFAKDLTSGMLYIGSAAAVIATAYNNGDVESAQDISVIDYAFGDNTGKPAGLAGHDQTYSQQAIAAAANAPQASMASLGMDSFITQSINLGYTTIYIYEDGSEKVISSGAASNVPGVTGTTDTTTYTDANGKVFRSTSTTKGKNGQGLPTTVTVDEQDGQKVTVVQTQNTDGSVTTSTTSPGPDGPVTTSITSHPSQSGGTQGPVQQAENDYNLQQQGW